MRDPTSNHDKAPAAVLVVDDAPVMRILIAEVLAHEGYSPVQAGSGQDALDLLNGVQAFDFLITDLHLQGAVDGHQLTSAAGSLRPGLKVIMITGDDAAFSALEEAPGRADAVLLKPFRMEQLCTLMEQLRGGAA